METNDAGQRFQNSSVTSARGLPKIRESTVRMRTAPGQRVWCADPGERRNA